MIQVSDSLITKLVHTVLIVLIVLYVVFVKKSVVESVPYPAKIVNTPSTLMKGPFCDPTESYHENQQ